MLVKPQTHTQTCPLTQSAQERGANQHAETQRFTAGSAHCSLFSVRLSPQDLTFYKRHAFSHSPFRGQVPWKLSLPQTNENPVDLCFLPPSRASQSGSQQHTSFLFVSFVQLSSFVHSPRPCQLKTCVSCYNTANTGPMHFGNMSAYHNTHARKHTSVMNIWVSHPFLMSAVSDTQRPCWGALSTAPTMQLVWVLAVSVVSFTTFNAHKQT